MHDQENDLNESELASLRGLRRDVEPPAASEARVLSELARRRSARRLPWMLGAAAAILIAAFFAGRFSATTSAPAAGERYILLLYGAAGGGEARVEEYREWARSVRRSGIAIRGERLDTGGEFVPARGSAGEDPNGYFIVTARSYEAAVEIARGSPHVRHGGRILVRRIAPS